MSTSPHEPQPNNEPDDYLIELMGLKEDFQEEALVAYGKIYRRYWDIMYTIAIRVAKDKDTAADLLSDTFNMVYNRASTFKAGKMRNPDNIRLSIQKWMTTIMQRIFYDHFLDDAYKKSSDEKELMESYIIDKKPIGKYVSEDYEDFIEQLEASERDTVFSSESVAGDIDDSQNLKRIKDYLSRLPERERDIVLTTYNYYIPDKYLPTAILDDLVQKWGTTRENIRKILQKFRRAIKQDLQQQIIVRK